MQAQTALAPCPDQGGLSIDSYGNLAGILNIAQERKGTNEPLKLKKLQLISVNDNQAEALVDRVGSGGRI